MTENEFIAFIALIIFSAAFSLIKLSTNPDKMPKNTDRWDG